MFHSFRNLAWLGLLLAPLCGAPAPGPVQLLAGPSEGKVCVLEPGQIREFWVVDSAGAAVLPSAITWTLKGGGQIGQAPGNARVEYRAARAGNYEATLTACSTLDPAQQVAFTLKVKPNPAAPAPAGVDLLPFLTYDAAERKQGSCDDCYAWAATAAIELELARRYGILDRLSIQYFHSIYRPLQSDAPADPCCANNFSAVLETYKLNRRMVPWSNPHAHYQDEAARCDQPRPAREPIGLLPNYEVKDLGSQQIETKLWSDEDIIEELKSVLSRGKGVITKMGGHYLVLVGYEAGDPDPGRHCWRLLDSVGVRADRPQGCFWLPMRPQDYNAMAGPNDYFFQFDYIDVLELELQAPAPPTIQVRPAASELTVGQPLALVASVGGRAPVTYQWERDGLALPGQTGSILSLPAVLATDAGNYQVRVSNDTGTAVSGPVQVAVRNAGIPWLSVNPGAAVLGAGASRGFRATLTGMADPRVLWTLLGPGQISAADANPVTYTGPASASSPTLIAQSLADPTLSARVELTVKTVDLNGDGSVDVLDLALLAQAYRSCQGDVQYLEAADLNGDGLVDEDDAIAFLAQLDAAP